MRTALGSDQGPVSVVGIDDQPVASDEGAGEGNDPLLIRLHGAAEQGFEVKVLVPGGRWT